MLRLALLAILAASPVAAETLVAARLIRAGTILSADDVARAETPMAGALDDPADAIGLEARVAIYAGRPLRPEDLGSPTIIDRNQAVPLVYQRGPLSIVTEGRALGRGGAGDMIRVMNVSSRSTVSGIIGADGAIRVATGAQ